MVLENKEFGWWANTPKRYAQAFFAIERTRRGTLIPAYVQKIDEKVRNLAFVAAEDRVALDPVFLFLAGALGLLE